MTPAPLAPAGAAHRGPLERARDEHRAAHEAYRVHWTTCPDCLPHRLCRVGQEALDRADDAGKRWEFAQTGRWPR